jgi:hypothetical protein
MEAANIEFNYEGTLMQVFHQIRVGRFRLYNAAARDVVGVVKEAWKRGSLGKTFLVRPLTRQLIGEEVLDGNGRVIAVFGLTVTNAFRPDPKVQQDYQEKLRTLLNQL